MAHFQQIDGWQGGKTPLVIVAWMVGFVFFLPSWAAASEFNSELVISSNKLTMDEKKEVATFIGAVVAKEGEMALFADRMVVYYYKKGKSDARGGVHKVLAIGHVIIEQAENKGHADRAEYMVNARKLTLIGTRGKSASILHGGDRLSGEKILLALGQNRRINNVSVLGTGKQRVSATISPSSIRNKKKKSQSRKKAQIKRVKKITKMEQVEGIRNIARRADPTTQLQIDSKPLSNSVSGVVKRFSKPKKHISSSPPMPAHPPLIAPKRRAKSWQ
jgi:lipopolysaccharide export system protein LptA